MKFLFVHQNFPGQYLHLAPLLAAKGHTVMALSNRQGVGMPGVDIVNYKVRSDFAFGQVKQRKSAADGTHPMLLRSRSMIEYGIAAANQAIELKQEGFNPDLICGHPGWGETLYLSDVWPRAPQLHYCEFFLRPFDPTSIFDPSTSQPLGAVLGSRANSGLILSALDAMGAGVSPTAWQKKQYPSPYGNNITQIHDGINCRVCQPNADATFGLPNGRVLNRQDRVVTYVARNLEPTRGFPEFMRAVEALLEKDSVAEVLIIGGDETSYGAPHPSGKTWRETMMAELDIDKSRVHFVGKVPYKEYIAALQISSAHVYFTVPFVLSWSVLEAMACGALVIASSTEPVQEVVSHGVNGLLFDFFDRSSLVDQVLSALEDPGDYSKLRDNARATILDSYSLSKCLPGQLELIERHSAVSG